MAANRSDVGPPTSPRVEFSWNGPEEPDFGGPGAVGSQIKDFFVTGKEDPQMEAQLSSATTPTAVP